MSSTNGFDSYWIETEDYQTSFEDIASEQRQELILTGYPAFDHIQEQTYGSGTPLEDQSQLWAYAEVEPQLPDGDQHLRVLFPEDMPSSVPYQDGVTVAEMDVLVDDMQRNNARQFQIDIEEDEEVRRMLQRHLSTEKKQTLIDKFTDTPYQYDEISEKILDLRPYYSTQEDNEI